MTAFDFPTSPAFGATYGPYTWDGEKWYSTQGGAGLAPPPFTPLALTGLGAVFHLVQRNNHLHVDVPAAAIQIIDVDGPVIGRE